MDKRVEDFSRIVRNRINEEIEFNNEMNYSTSKIDIMMLIQSEKQKYLEKLKVSVNSDEELVKGISEYADRLTRDILGDK